jgi:hypothetical protein
MRNWKRWIIIGLVAFPVLGYAVTRYRARAAMRPACHCAHK